jgi:hypothetical protein
MSDVHDGYFWIDFENDSLYGSDQMVVGTVVGRQCDDGVAHEVLPLRVFGAHRAPRSRKALRTF